MNLTRILLLSLITFGAWHHYHKSSGDHVLNLGEASPNGFFAMPSPENADKSQVIIFAPIGCPREAGQRAAALAESLGQQNIPIVQSDSANFELADATPALLQRVDTVMKGEIPIVFVKGKAKANPTLAEVLAEYQSSD